MIVRTVGPRYMPCTPVSTIGPEVNKSVGNGPNGFCNGREENHWSSNEK